MEAAAQAISKTARKHLRNTWVHRLPITSWVYKRMLHFAVPVEERAVNFRHKTVWVNTKDTSIVPSVISGDYETFELDIFMQLLKPGVTLLDIGANMGIYSLLAADKAKRIFAFEPVPENLSLLRKSVKANSASSVKVIPAAVGEKDGSVEMHIIPNSLGTHGIYADSESTLTVQIVSIDNFIKEHSVGKVDLMKIDVEGYEPYVVKGAIKTLKKYKPIILMELDSSLIKASQADPKTFVKELFSIYKYCYLIDERKKELTPLSVDEASELTNSNLVLSPTELNL